jgi:TorA maturation chaperone TorD
MQEYLRFRAKLYRLLALPFYKESTPEYLEELQKHLPVFDEMAKQSGIETLAEGAGELKELFSENPVTDKVIDAHERMFARLFLCVAPPESPMNTITAQESPYLSASGLIMQEPRDEIIELLVKEKVGLDKSFKEPEDHLSAEFHFMAALSLRLSQMLEVGENIASNVNTQMELLEKHLCRWAPLLCGDLSEEAATLAEKEAGRYFIGIAKLTEGFVEFDRSYMEEFSQSFSM